MSFDLRSSRVAQTAQVAGVAVRYSFYIAGAFVFAVISMAVLTVWGRVAQVSGEPAQPTLQLTAAEFAKLQPMARSIKSPGGWQETLQYGQLHDRDLDFTLTMDLPKDPDRALPRDFQREMLDLRPIAGGATSYPEAYYDLETRFGPVRASRFQIKTDGRVKLCLSYLSRFETSALTYKGWFCEANGAKPSAYWLACLLDKVTLKGPLPSSPAHAFFSEKAGRSPRCAADPVSQSTDTRAPRPLKRLL